MIHTNEEKEVENITRSENGNDFLKLHINLLFLFYYFEEDVEVNTLTHQ